MKPSIAYEGTPQSGSSSPQGFGFYKRFVGTHGSGRFRYLRSPAERTLLNWVLFWVVMAGVAILIMLFLLIKVNQHPVIDEKMEEKLRIYRRNAEEAYSSFDEVSRHIINETDSNQIRDILKSLISAGGKPMKTVEYVKKLWSTHGLDMMELFSYNVLMSVPDPANENKVELYKNGALSFTATNKEVGGSHMGPAFYAYSAAGDVKDTYVYVNYGTMADYDLLMSSAIDVEGKICIARVGKISRSKKARNAETMGAVGLVLFMDPNDVGPQARGGRPFPDSWWVGGSALQRGSVAYVAGDPSTPGYPSKAGMYRVPADNMTAPKIPCQPIGYDDARAILQEMNAHECPDSWKPKLEIPCYVEAPPTVMLRIAVYNQLQSTEITNIVGTINGRREADRLVIVGHHRDSVGKASASDPLLGVSQLLEVTRVFGTLRLKGWRPLRTMMFSLWDGEEQGLLGSTEWVEDHMATLRSRAVLYIGADVLSGDQFRPRSSAAVSASIRRSASIIPHYKDKDHTLLTAWTADPKVKKNRNSMPLPWPIIGRSDDAAFVFSAGVPTAFMQFTRRPGSINQYPAQHTGYDTYEMVEKYVDPGFRISQMSARMIASLARQWADRSLLPFELRELSNTIRNSLDAFAVKYKGTMKTHNLNIAAPLQAVEEFQQWTEIFMNWTREVDMMNPIIIRVANDMMIRVEKAFISPGGIPTRDVTVRNLVYSPDGFMFPGLVDAITRIPVNVDAFGRQAALLTEVLCQATSNLRVSPI
ncbi:N-acetylated-alpha-linked acidic dipeptidase 2-like isoform X2 [Ornithodoros turicata]|uniref:N-acetylated-alpha-linked acidic dipeptidase 2-like isoform X2 n=1 Tax=Ornithodoros turicata TaxID=34597 RepID=UPI0031390394